MRYVRGLAQAKAAAQRARAEAQDDWRNDSAFREHDNEAWHSGLSLRAKEAERPEAARYVLKSVRIAKRDLRITHRDTDFSFLKKQDVSCLFVLRI